MSRMPLPVVPLVLATALIVLPLGGCAYDYMQRSDKIAHSSGNAVKANLERETANPSRKSAGSTKGLGQNGAGVVSPASDDTTGD